MTRSAILFVIICILLSGCSSNRQIKTSGTPQLQTVFVKQIIYGEHGLPELKEVLNERPVELNEKFTLVLLENGKPVRSFEIIILSPRRPSLARPLEVIFAWTGKGYEVGCDNMGAVPTPMKIPKNKDDLAANMAMVAAPVIVGTVTGFVVGVVESVKMTGEDFLNITNTTTETLLSFSEYEYDISGKLLGIMTFLPGNPPIKLVTTTYHYSDNSLVPAKAEVLSHADNTVRTVE